MSPPANKRKWVFALAALLLLAVGIFVATRGDESDSVTVRGLVVLIQTSPGDVEGSWDSCHGTGGYDDFDAGTFFSLSDADGTKVGGGSLERVQPDDFEWLSKTDFFTDSGQDAPDPDGVEDSLRNLEGYLCMLVWETEVKPSDFYVLEVSHRGESTYSFKDLQAQGFVIEQSLGG